MILIYNKDMNLKVLKNGGYTAIIDLDNGANCVSLRHEKISGSILREPDLKTGFKDNPYLFGSPILFPVNRISEGKFVFEDRLYQHAINEKNTNCHLHGFLHESKFDLLSLDQSSLICSYKKSASLGFMHDYEIVISYFLTKDGLTQKTTVKNNSNLNMPCMLGFHTTFDLDFCGEGDILVFADVCEEIERNMSNYLPTGKTLSLDKNGQELKSGNFIPKQISKHYRASGNFASVLNVTKNLKAVIEYDEKYMFRLIYGTDRFLCLEPQTCIVNAPNLTDIPNDGFDFVKPFSSKEYHLKIYLSEENL